MKFRYAAAAAVAAVALAGCGGGQPSMPAANVTVCHHYMAQRAWAKGLTFPTLADTVELVGYISADAAEAVPGTKLARDLNRMVANISTRGNAYYDASKAVYEDCKGV